MCNWNNVMSFCIGQLRVHFQVFHCYLLKNKEVNGSSRSSQEIRPLTLLSELDCLNSLCASVMKHKIPRGLCTLWVLIKRH